MKKLLFFLFFSILSVNADFKTNEFSLKNGMNVIMIERKSVPIISLSVWYKCGSKCDMLSKSGVAHFLEHLACFNQKREFGNYLEEIGSENNAFTSINTICFYEVFPKDCLEKVLFFEAKRMKNLEVEDKVFQNEKKAILEERGMRVDADIHGKYSEVFSSNIFNRQIGGIPVIGWKHEIESITIEDLKTFYKTWIVPKNATMILVGDFEKESAKQLIEKYFERNFSASSSVLSTPHSASSFPDKKELRREVDKGVNREFNRGIRKKLIECRSVENGPSASIQYVFKIPFLFKDNLKKSLALGLALETLEQPSSFVKNILKQMNNIISKVDFSYTDSVYQYDILTVTFDATSIDNLDKIKDAWPYLVKKISADCVRKTDLQKIKKKKLISLAYKKEDIEKISNYFGWNLISGLSMKEILSIDDLIQSITAKECNDILREVFSSYPIAVMKTLPKGYDRD